jgi:hypothetical protein
VQRQVGFDERHFLGHRHGGPALGQQHVAVHIGQLLQKLLSGRVPRLDERGQGVEVVEQEMWVELALQSVELGLGLGADQLLGAVQSGLPLLKKVRRFVEREHGHSGHQAEANRFQQLGRR